MDESTMIDEDTHPDCDDKPVRVCPISQSVTIECHRLPETQDIGGGVLCTGFFDVEKLIMIKHHDDHFTREKVLLMEKKLPFQLLILEVKQEDNED